MIDGFWKVLTEMADYITSRTKRVIVFLGIVFFIWLVLGVLPLPF